MKTDLIVGLAKAKGMFQQRAILAAMGVRPEQIEPVERRKPFSIVDDGALQRRNGDAVAMRPSVRPIVGGLRV